MEERITLWRRGLHYGGEDYTMEERNDIKKWVDKAKEKNQDGISKFIWKARGTPKNRIMKFTKR